MNKPYNLFIHLLAICGVLGFIFLVQRLEVPQWLLVKSGPEFGISGIAFVEQEKDSLSFLIVHDTKGDKPKPRFALVKLQGNNSVQYLPLKLANVVNLPTDLEALTVVPQKEELSFMALTSYGKVYHIKLEAQEQKVSLLGSFDLPKSDPQSNFEGFALQKIDDILLAVWADRGSETRPGIIYWGRLSLPTYKITQEGSASLRVPFPVKDVRHIADLKVDQAGIVYISASRDSGNNGAFESAVYTVGAFCLYDNHISFRANQALVVLYHFPAHKVEAIELVTGASGGLVVGSDDENQGGSIRTSK